MPFKTKFNKNQVRLLNVKINFAGHTRSHKSRNYFCPSFLQPQYSSPKLNDHFQYCRQNECSRIIMKRHKNKFLQFNNFRNMQKAPVVVYADFECILKKLNRDDDSTNTKKLQHHSPSGFCMIDCVSCCSKNGMFQNLSIYRSDDAVNVFLDQLIEKAIAYAIKRKYVVPLNMQPSDWQLYHKNKNCFLCKQRIPADKKVRDHCHICGKFRGVAHSACNLSFILPTNNSGFSQSQTLRWASYFSESGKYLP